MKTLLFAVLLSLLISGVSFAQDQIGSSEPAISLFKSVEIIKEYLNSQAKQDYSDKYLHSVSYHYLKGTLVRELAGCIILRSKSRDSVAASVFIISWTARSLNSIMAHDGHLISGWPEI